jgi:hypothetical protein
MLGDEIIPREEERPRDLSSCSADNSLAVVMRPAGTINIHRFEPKSWLILLEGENPAI